MPKRKLKDAYTEPFVGEGAYSPANRENQLINAAYELAEQRIRDGTASDTLITQFLKMGSQRERLERVILEQEAELKAAKTEALQSAKRIEELYSQAIASAQRYRIDDNEDGEIVQ